MSKRYKPDHDAITEAHTRIPITVLDSHAYRALSYSAKSLLIEFYKKVKSTNNGNLNMVQSILEPRGWNSPTTLSKSLKELIALGFIAVTKKSIGVKNGSKMCNLYRLTDRPSYEWRNLHIEASKATKDYLQFETIKEAKAVIRKVLNRAKEIEK